MMYKVTSTDWGIDRLTVTNEEGGQYSATLSPAVVEAVEQQINLMHMWVLRAQRLLNGLDNGAVPADNGQVSTYDATFD